MSAKTSSVGAWILAARPATWSAAFVPVAVGTAVALFEGAFHAGAALAALLGAIFIQIGTNFANDVYDYEKGADTHERLGPTRAVAAGLLTPSDVRIGMWAAFGIATLFGVYLAWVAGPVVVAIGVASVLSGLWYTMGRFSLAYLGLGDLFVMIFFGFVAVTGTAFVQSGQLYPLALWASVPVGALATAILVVNNVRDRNTDVRAAKKTLVVRFGRAAGVAEYVLLCVASYAVPVLLALEGRVSKVVLLPLVTAPFAIVLVRELATTEGRPLNATLKKTSILLLAYGVLFAIGLAASPAVAAG